MTVESQTHCKRGHALTEDNVYVSGRNRCCRQCTLTRSESRYDRLTPEEKEDLLYRQVVRQTGRTRSEYEAAYASQGGRCAICGRIDLDRRLCSDHDHSCCEGKTSCGKCVRGFLCQGCNQGIGFLLDSPELLRRAAGYIEDWKRIHETGGGSSVVRETPTR